MFSQNKATISLDDLHKLTRDLSLLIESEEEKCIKNIPFFSWCSESALRNAKNVDEVFQRRNPGDITDVILNITRFTFGYFGTKQAHDYISAARKCSITNEQYRHRWFHKDENCSQYLDACQKHLKSILQKEKEVAEARQRVFGNRIKC